MDRIAHKLLLQRIFGHYHTVSESDIDRLSHTFSTKNLKEALEWGSNMANWKSGGVLDNGIMAKGDKQ